MPEDATGQSGKIAQLVQMLSKMITPTSSSASIPVPGLMDAKIQANEIPTESSGNLPPSLINQLMKDPRFLQYLNTMNAKSGMAKEQYITDQLKPLSPMTGLQPIGPSKPEDSLQQGIDAIRRMKQQQGAQ